MSEHTNREWWDNSPLEIPRWVVLTEDYVLCPLCYSDCIEDQAASVYNSLGIRLKVTQPVCKCCGWVGETE